MAEYIDREAAKRAFNLNFGGVSHAVIANRILDSIPAADVAPVVRCQNCIHAEPLDRNCELSPSLYMHCKMWRGEEEKNVWHKYKRYYKDYSLVERDGFCSSGARMDGE